MERVLVAAWLPLVAGHDIRTPCPSTLTTRHVPSDAFESPEHPNAWSEIRQSDRTPLSGFRQSSGTLVILGPRLQAQNLLAAP
ncbi:hypothetical protein STEG23_024933 [Scotinomys teguina]